MSTRSDYDPGYEDRLTVPCYCIFQMPEMGPTNKLDRKRGPQGLVLLGALRRTKQLIFLLQLNVT